MRYALNVTPINGWETHAGNGVANLALEAGAQGHLELRARGNASLALTASGDGSLATLGEGAAAMVLALTGVGYSRIHGVGAADQVLTAIGDGIVIPFAGGRARLVLKASGNGVVAPRHAGVAAMRLSAHDGSRNSIAVRGNGHAEFVMTGRYGIPLAPLHPGFIGNKRDRQARVSADDRYMRVPGERSMRPGVERPLRVARERRA